MDADDKALTTVNATGRNYSTEQIRARMAEVFPMALTKVRADTPAFVSADLHHAPQSGDGTAIIINVKMANGLSRIIINVPPDGECRPLHPDRIGGCGNIFDNSFERVLTAVILRAISA
jgi:hypothetical protein